MGRVTPTSAIRLRREFKRWASPPRLHNRIQAAFIFVFACLNPFLSHSANCANVQVASVSPAWWDNQLGMNPVIVPGFSPINVSGTEVALSQRVYAWAGGYFPASITSRNTELTRSMQLTAKVGDATLELKASRVTIEHTPTFAVIRATGEPIPNLKVEVDTRVEYDGVAMSTIQLIPTKPVVIGGMDFRVAVLDAASTEVIGFKAKSIGKQKQREDMLKLPYAGEFVNAIGVADGDRSFWWFADNAEGWIWNADTVTELKRAEGVVELRQRLIGDTWRIDTPMVFRINFLATPVKSLVPDWRESRVLAGPADESEAKLGSRINPWWTSAFAYDTYPYLELASTAKQKVPLASQRAYPGLRANAALVRRDLQLYGVHRLPYFSAHALSELDDVLLRYKSDWAAEPPRIFKDVVGPYRKVYDKPVMTHRARSYSDYLLWRLDKVIDQLDIEGIYFDHGPPVMSNNPRNGAWYDSNGRKQPSLDILGMREFLKRLRVLFALRGKAGYILLQNANREVMPAYTFAYATVDGEQYRSGEVQDGDYLARVSLGELRTRLSPHQYGIPVIWLPSAWTYHRDNKDWDGSPAQRTAYRRLMALALLHDTMDWPKGAHPAERQNLLEILDEFGIADARFIGYWSRENPLTVDSSQARVSTYVNEEANSSLGIVMNTSTKPVSVHVKFDMQRVADHRTWRVRTGAGASTLLTGETPFVALEIAPRDFQWLWIKEQR